MSRIDPKHISLSIATDLELAAEALARENADIALSEDIATHASQHLPDGMDALSTSVPVNIDYTNSVGISNSLSRSDHVHAISLFHDGVSDSALITTSSLTFILMNGMTRTPPAGKYLILGGVGFRSDTNNAEVDMSLYVNNTMIVGSRRHSTPKTKETLTTTIFSLESHAVATVNGSETIEIRWLTTAGTATALDRKLSIIRIG